MCVCVGVCVCARTCMFRLPGSGLFPSWITEASRMEFQVENSVLIDCSGEFIDFSSSYIDVFQSAEATARKLMGKSRCMLGSVLCL